MNELENILKNHVNAIESGKSPQIVMETVLFKPLITAKFDEKGNETKINPLRICCHEYSLGPFVFSKALDDCCREADSVRAKINTALWNDLEELFLYYSWTEGGLPSKGAG